MSHPSPVATDRSFDIDEYLELMAAVRWGESAATDVADVAAALEAPHFVGHVRDELGQLVGFVSAFSDGVFATFVNELAVHPGAQGAGLGSQLLNAVEAAYPGVPVFAVGFRDARRFFLSRGYTYPAQPLEIYAKLNGHSQASA